MKKTVITLCLALAFSPLALAQESVAMGFAIAPRDPSALARGGNTLLGSSAAYSALLNPASGVFSSERLSFAGSYGRWNPSSEVSTRNVFGGVSYNIGGKIGISGAFAYDKGQAYSTYNTLGVSTGSFTPTDLAGAVALAYKPLNFLSVGVAAKYFRSGISDATTLSATAFDLVAEGRLGGGFSAALALSNMGGKVDGKWDLPSSVAIAAGYGLGLGERSFIEASAQLDCYLAGGANIALGAEYSFGEMLFARAGYNISADGLLPSFLSAGAGVSLGGVTLDFACLCTGPLAGTMSFGLGYSF